MVQWTGTAGSPVVSGSDAVTTPGSYSYIATGGAGSNTWSCVGTGANIDQDGNLSLSGACGMITVVCEDCCGNQDSIDIRVTNSGSWQNSTENCFADPPCPWNCWQGGWSCNDNVQGNYKYDCIINMNTGHWDGGTYDFDPPCAENCSSYVNPSCFDAERHFVCYCDRYEWGC